MNTEVGRRKRLRVVQDASELKSSMVTLSDSTPAVSGVGRSKKLRSSATILVEKPKPLLVPTTSASNGGSAKKLRSQIAAVRVQVHTHCCQLLKEFDALVKPFDNEYAQAVELLITLRETYRPFKFVQRYQQAMRLLKSLQNRLIPALRSTNFGPLTDNNQISLITSNSLKCVLLECVEVLVPALLRAAKQLSLSFADATAQLQLRLKGLTTSCIAIVASAAALYRQCMQFVTLVESSWWPSIQLLRKVLIKFEAKLLPTDNNDSLLRKPATHAVDNEKCSELVNAINDAEIKALYFEVMMQQSKTSVLPSRISAEEQKKAAIKLIGSSATRKKAYQVAPAVGDALARFFAE